MSDPARFLTSFAQALAAMTLYRDGHPARGRAVDAAYQELHDLQADTARPLFTFLGDEVVYGRLPLPAFESLLDALAASASRTTRRGLLDRLARAPRELGPGVVARLRGEQPWYVVRNLLLVLDALPALPEGFSSAPFAGHADARVRREALKLALKVSAERERALIGALRDADPRTARLALSAALDNCPAPAVPLVVGVARDSRAASEVRVLAIKVLGRSRHPEIGRASCRERVSTIV